MADENNDELDMDTELELEDGSVVKLGDAYIQRDAYIQPGQTS